MTDQSSDHNDQFEELAAGYALDALEPADEQAFLRHASDCPECTEMIASYREVAAAIAAVVPPPAAPRPQLADRIMATVRAGLDPNPAPASAAPPAQADAGAAPAPADTAGTPAQPEPSPEVVPLRPRRRWLRPVAAAAAVAVIAGGIWGGLAATSGTPAPTIASCQQPACHQTALSSVTTHQPAAKVLVQGKNVWVVPTSMKADNSANQIYVLWQITDNGKRLTALGGFDVHPGGAGTTIKVGQLAVPYPGTKEFAISLEPGRTVPVSPTKVVAAGVVS